MKPRIRSALVLVAALALPLIAGAIGSIATRDSVQTWYPTLERPAWTPPDFVFGPVWTVLYLLMGVASWRVWRRGWRRRDVRLAIYLYLAHLPLNVLWSFIFFRWHRIGWAAVEIVVLLLAIAIVTWRFGRVDRIAGALLVPYLAWVAFATALNVRIWQLERAVAA
jgi:translocator protein